MAAITQKIEISPQQAVKEYGFIEASTVFQKSLR